MENSIWDGITTDRVKGKRGRHKKDCQCEKCIAKRSAPPDPNNLAGERPEELGESIDENQIEIDFDADNVSVEEELKTELASDEKSETVLEGDLSTGSDSDDIAERSDNDSTGGNNRVHFTGTFVLIMLDNFLPKGIIWAAKEVGYKTDKKPVDLKLTEKEIEELSPLADEIIRKYFKTLTLEQQFIIGITMAYGSKL